MIIYFVINTGCGINSYKLKKIRNKKSNARKKSWFAGICSESLWILLFPLKKIVKKIADRWRSHVTPK